MCCPPPPTVGAVKQYKYGMTSPGIVPEPQRPGRQEVSSVGGAPVSIDAKSSGEPYGPA
jgi:hypothetical protein